MSSQDSRIVLRAVLAPLALILLASVAAAQPAPGAAPAASPSAPTAQPAAPASTELPKSSTQAALEEKLHAMRSGKGLTSDEAARRSVKNSPLIEAKRHAIEGVDGQLDQTRYSFWPKVKLGASYTHLSPVHPKFGGGPLPTDPVGIAALQAITPLFASLTKIPTESWSLDGQLSVPLSDYLLRVSHALSGASLARDAAVYDRKATYASVDRDARVAYYGWVRSQAQELIAAQSLEQATGHQKDAGNAFQAGLVSKADVLATQAAVKNAELFVERAKNQTALARLGLEVSMGDAPDQKYEVGEDVFGPSPELSSLPSSAAAFREAANQRMELKSLGAAAQASREQAALTQIGDYPRLDGNAGMAYANPNQRFFPLQQQWNLSWQVGVALSWTPTDIGVSESAKGIANAKAAELEAQRRAVSNGLRLEIEQALRAAEEARYTIDVSGHGLAAADESYRVRRELFRAGRATLVEVTDAETELTRARLELADAFVNSRIALAQLRHALGRDAEPARQSSP